MKTAYLDCFSGVSGDMFLGALLDAGLSFEQLKGALETLPFQGYELKKTRESRMHISGTRFFVHLKDHTHDEKKHEHRGLKAVCDIIDRGQLPRRVKEKSRTIFESLARVEAHIHNVSPEEVHFHEVGAVDAIIDIVGTVYGIDTLGIDQLVVSPLPLGTGFVKAAHGQIPVPSPAALALLKGIPVAHSGVSHEMVTPTGAALTTGLADEFGAMPPMVIDQVGYGVGSRDLEDRPNLLRIIIGHETAEAETESVLVLESNLDDMSPEWLGYLMERLFEAGALDVIFIPVQMKKSRPGVQVQVMGKPVHKDRLMEILVHESTTLGIRFHYTQRTVLKRSFETVDSPWGPMQVKRIGTSEGPMRLTPEYEACKEIALKNRIPLRNVYQWVNGLKP